MYHQAVRDHFLGPTKPGLLIVRAAVGVLLLMSCANIANLLLIRASAREQEIAIRRALGVSPAHVAASADRGRCPCGTRWRRRSDDRVVGNLAAGGQWSGRDVDRSGITIKGRPLDNPAAAPDADRFGVRPEYFETMRIPLVRGRLLDETDSREAAAVAVIGKTMAEQLWPGEDPIGHRIRVGGGPTNPMRTIVGIVGDARHYGLHMPATSQVYVPHTQGHYPEPMMAVVVRVGGRNSLGIAPAVREQVRALDPLQPVTDIQTYDAIVG